jgi:outer membrane receptor protein involved in Fe transport
VKGLDLSVDVYNLFDRRYADPGSTEHPEESIPQDGRNFAVKTVFRF